MLLARFGRGTISRNIILTARKAVVREEYLQAESTIDEVDASNCCQKIKNNSLLNQEHGLESVQKVSLPMTTAGLFKSGSSADSVTAQKNTFEKSPSSPTSTRS